LIKSSSLLRLWIVTFVFLPFCSGPAWAQGSPQPSESPCLNSHIAAVVSRPTVANATDPTQCGVVEAEYGFEHQWVGAGAHHNDFAGGLRFGLTPNLDFHWYSAAFLNIADGSGSRSGFGDTWLGLKYRFVRQSKHRPSFGAFYAAKIPSASVVKGLGSGEVDHSLSFLASKDIHKVHLDFNVIQLLIGRHPTPGVDHTTGLALASWITLTRRLTLVVEPYGYTLLNQSNPAFASTMGGFSYQLQPRVYLDAGLDVGVTHGAPNKRVYCGITYSLANVYSLLKSR